VSIKTAGHGQYFQTQKSIVMKKLATVFTAIVKLFSGTAFAAEGANVAEKVKAAFQGVFAQASQVSWTTASDFYFASFDLKGVKVDAAYNEAGELVGTSRKIGLEQLPLSLSMELNKKYADYKLSGTVYELNYDGATSYYIRAENEKQVLNLKGSANGEIETEKRIKK